MVFLPVINIFCLLISCLVIGIYCTYYYAVSHIDYLDVVKIVSLASLLIIAPSLLGIVFNKAKNNLYIESQCIVGMFFFSVFLGLGAHIAHFNISLLVIVFGAISLVVACFKYYKLLIKVEIWRWLLILVIAFSYAIVITSQYYVINTPTSPLLIQRLIIGRLTTDPVYLAGIANIINTYNIPSWGIDGISYLRYHWGSIWFLTMVANLLHISIVKSYTLLYPAVFVPLMFKAFFLFCQQVSRLFKKTNFCDKKDLIAIIVIVALAITSLYPFLVFQPQSEIGSDSYTVALFFAFLLVTIVLHVYRNSVFFTKLKKPDILVITVEFPIMLLLIGMTKVSVFYDIILLYFYCLLRGKFYKRTMFFVLSAMIFFIVGIVYYFFQHGSPMGRIVISPFDYLAFKNEHVFQNFAWFNHFLFSMYIYNFLRCIGHFSFFYFWSWMFIIAKYFHYKFCQRHNMVVNHQEPLHISGMRYFDVEIVIFLFLINGLVGYSLKIGGGSAFYFLDITRWVSIALFFGVLTRMICLCDEGL